jgi:sulfoxide reductase heme-binding subunit YedZ
VTDPFPHLFWITSRAAGSAALILTSLSVSVGLVMAIRIRRSGRGPELRALHEALALAGLLAIAVHGASLLGDKYLHPSVIDISVPFASRYRTGWTGLGVVAGWGLAVLGLSYYVRARIGVARWRKLHRLTILAWALGAGHSLGEGTDAGQVWFLAMTAAVALPAVVLVTMRAGRSGHRPDRAASRPTRPEARQLEHDSSAAELGIGDGDRSAVGFDDRLGDREPEAGPADRPAPRRVRPVEAVEDEGALLDWNPGSVVFDREGDPA